MEDTVYSSSDRVLFVLTVSLRGKVSAARCSVRPTLFVCFRSFPCIAILDIVQSVGLRGNYYNRFKASAMRLCALPLSFTYLRCGVGSEKKIIVCARGTEG